MIKQIKNLKGIILVMLLVFTFIAIGKTRVNIGGNINIDFGRGNSSNDYWDNNGNNNRNSYNVGDITDSQYELKPFLLNKKGYAIIRNYNRYFILQVEFYNGNLNVKREVVFDAKVQSSNCLSIEGDDRYCLTITPKGQPALWDRYNSKLKYIGKWITNNYNNYYDNSYDYYDSNQHWFEW